MLRCTPGNWELSFEGVRERGEEKGRGKGGGGALCIHTKKYFGQFGSILFGNDNLLPVSPDEQQVW